MSLATYIKQRFQNRNVLLLFLILAIGIFLRVYDLGAESLWLDEAISVKFSSGDVNTILKESGLDRTNPPLYWLMLHYWISLFGTSETAVRSLSAVLGIVAIVITYLVGKELFNRKIGLFAALISAISPFHIYYSQETRNYALLLLLSLLSYLFFIKILKQGKNWYYLCYFLANLFLGYTHAYGLLIIASQILYFCILWRKYKPQRYRLVTSFIGTVIALSPLIIVLGPKASRLIEHGFWISEPTIRTLGDTFAHYSGRGDLRIIALGFFLLFALVGFFVINSREGKDILKRPFQSLRIFIRNVFEENLGVTLLLLLWLTIPILIPFIISQFTTPIYTSKYTIGASSAFYLFIARGINNLDKRWLIYSALCIIIILSGIGLHGYYTNDIKAQWREVADLVEANTKENDVIVLYPKHETPFNYYYKGNILEYGINKNASFDEGVVFVDDIIEGKERLWLIMAADCCTNTANINNYLTDNYTILLQQKFRGIALILFGLHHPTTS